MKKIGFIDYYISEWHANKYPAWIASASEKLGEDFSVAYAWAELDVSPVDGVSTDEWCERMGAQRCESIAQLCEMADYICILAPSDPEKHLEYVKEAFKYGKNTYVDKTFAPDYATAEKIFEIAEQYGTKFFSSSALRYASELDELCGARSLITVGSGSNFEEYIIHLCEMTVKLLGCEVKRLRVDRQGERQSVVRVELGDGKVGTMVFCPGAPYSVCGEGADGAPIYKKIEGAFFERLIEDILRFYISGERSFDPRETLAVMKLIDLCLLAKKNPDTWVEM